MILCAAVKYKDIVIPCHRHCDGYEILYKLHANSEYRVNTIEGFITIRNEFLDRKEAFIDAMACGQLSAVTRQYKQDNFETELYSEDLYWL